MLSSPALFALPGGGGAGGSAHYTATKVAALGLSSSRVRSFCVLIKTALSLLRPFSLMSPTLRFSEAVLLRLGPLARSRNLSQTV